MNFTRELRHQILDPALSTDKRARLRCALAKQLEEIGEYEGAREAMDDLWPVFSKPPDLKGLDQSTVAEVLLRVGTLTGWIGSTRQSQARSKRPRILLVRALS